MIKKVFFKLIVFLVAIATVVTSRASADENEVDRAKAQL
jgi:hypothetical protein